MGAERSLLCAALIERDQEFAALRSAVEELGDARGGVVVLAGEAGVGKTRLAREAGEFARARGLAVLSGRAVPGGSPVPYRALTEAFLPAFRRGRPTDAPVLAGFGGQLAKLVPAWGTGGAGGADESPVLLGEAVVRLLRLVSAEDGALLLLEDLHWADAETLAVVEYLADTLRHEPVLCLCTTRPEADAVSLMSRLRRSPDVTVLGLERLTRPGIERAVASCLRTETAPADVVESIAANSEGNPFLVEELLAGLVSSGALHLRAGRWQSTGRLVPSVPFDFGHSVRNRLSTLDETSRRVLRAAALLGRRFDWELLPGLTDVDGRTIVDALRLALDAQIVEVDGNDFRFRHALTREAVLGELLPPERRELARRALPAVERAHPGLPGAWCELAADLAEQAGDDEAAARHLIEFARRALAGGALASAEQILARARRLATDPEVRDDLDDVLVRVLALAGKPTEAAAVGDPLVQRLGVRGDQADRLADVLVVLARAAVTGGDAGRAHTMIGQAQQLLDRGRLADALAARVQAVAAHVAFEQGRLEDATTLGRAAVDRARATDQPAVECEALEVLGRADRDSPDLSPHFQRGIVLAERHGLTTWLLRVKHEAAIMRALSAGDVQPLADVRELAAAAGALVTVAVMDLVLADFALGNFDRDACLEHATRCVEASGPYRLGTLPVAQLWLAGAHALRGDAAAMDAAAARALEADPDDPRILGDLSGRVRASLAMVRDDRESLRTSLEQMMTFVRVASPLASAFPNRILWALLATVEDDDHGAAARAELAAATHLRSWPAFPRLCEMVEAVAAGRRGERDEATARYAEAASALGETIVTGTIQYGHLLAAEAAIRDGWGEPARWLRPAEAFFADAGYDRIARRCRVALAEAGVPVPRRSRAGSVVPAGLRAVGITSREFDVLTLVAEGLTNREIAERLVLSPKTVERHLSSLFDRTGVRTRGELGDYARQIG